MTSNVHNSWSMRSIDSKLEIIAEVYESGMSSTDLAKAIIEAIGDKVTISRNAIIGFYHRTRENAAREHREDPLAAYPLRASGLAGVDRERMAAIRAEKKEKQRLAIEARRIARLEERERRKIEEKEAPPQILTDIRFIPGTDTIDIPLEDYGVPLLELDGCKWPTGLDAEGRHLFCNHERYTSKPTDRLSSRHEVEHPYCRRHYQQSYRIPEISISKLIKKLRRT